MGGSTYRRRQTFLWGALWCAIALTVAMPVAGSMLVGERFAPPPPTLHVRNDRATEIILREVRSGGNDERHRLAAGETGSVGLAPGCEWNTGVEWVALEFVGTEIARLPRVPSCEGDYTWTFTTDGGVTLTPGPPPVR